MRSVVVGLPASICAMIPMLRTLSRAFVATVASSSSQLLRDGVLLARVVRGQHQYSAEQECDIPARRCSGLPAAELTPLADSVSSGRNHHSPLLDYVTSGNARRPCSTRP